jgi:protein SCO1/2
MLLRRAPRLAVCLAALLTATGCVRRYAASGLVIATQPDRVVVSHREIPGVMPAMAMPVRVRDAIHLKPGDQIDFRLTPKTSSIDRIKRRATIGEGLTGGLQLQLPPETVATGQLVPDFTLTTHEGQPLTLRSLQPNIVAVNFIYTRCPLPDVCPRLTSHFARLQRRFAGKPVRFLTITLDPQFDAAAVLKDYARRWRADSNIWHLLTGGKGEIDAIAARFGMLYWPEAGMLTHTSMTTVIDQDGRLAARIEGSSYDAAQLGDWIDTLLVGGSKK